MIQRPAQVTPLDLEPALPPGRDASQGQAPEARSARIAQAAYFMALARGFAPGRELDDWLAAEDELERDGSATQV